MKFLDLSKIPKYINGRYRGKCDWRNSINIECNFIYNELKDKVQILEYNSREQKLKVKYQDKHLWISTSHFKLCKLGNLIGKKTTEYRYRVNEILNFKNHNIQIIKKLKVNNSKGYEYKCLNCNNINHISEGNLKLNKGCPICCKGSRKVVRGINDIVTTNPFLNSLMANKNDGYKYTQNSSKYLDWKCPNCGAYILHRRIIDIHKRGLNCPCSTNHSYGEKILCYVLKELNVNFEVHRRFNWSDNREYDFYIPAIDTIIEVNGIQHYSDSFESCGGRSLKEEQENDIYKKSLALNNNIKKYIIVDSQKSKFEYIKDSIIKSELRFIYDVQNVDWSLIKKIIAIKTDLSVE